MNSNSGDQNRGHLALDGANPVVSQELGFDQSIPDIVSQVWPSRSGPHVDGPVLVACDGLSLELAFAGRNLPVVAITEGSVVKPLQSISDALESYRRSGQPIRALHVVAHGQPGAISLGGEFVDRTDLLDYRAQLAEWGVERIVLWSCEVAQDPAFVALLEEFTGASVLASSQCLGMGETLRGSGWSEMETMVEALPFTLAIAMSSGQTSAYTEGASDTLLNQQITVDSSSNADFTGGYIDFAIGTNGAATDKLSIPQSNSFDTTLGAVSLVGTTVYVGLGSGNGAAVAGTVDATRNGLGGQPLRINLSNEFANGDFSQGTLGWDVVKGNIDLDKDGTGISTLAGQPTAQDSTKDPNNLGYFSNETSGTQNVYARNVGGTNGNVLNLDTGDFSLSGGGYGIIKGPAVVSQSSVVLQTGDTVSFDWKALAGGDAFDAYGYLVDINTGATINLIDQTAATAYGMPNFQHESLAVSSAQEGVYKFVFVAGSFDASGGKFLGGELQIDNIELTVPVSRQISITEDVVQSLVRGLQYSSSLNDSSTASTLGADKSVTITVVDSNGETGVTSLPIQLLESPDNDFLFLSANQQIAQSVNGTASSLSGGTGTDTLNFSSYGSGVSVDLSAGTSTAIVNGITSFENIVGSSYADTLLGDAVSNSISGGSGADSIEGVAGNNTLTGGAGNDTIVGGTGADSISGGADNDELEAGTDTGLNTIDGGSGDDSIVASSSTGSNTLTGGTGFDAIISGSGNDLIDGGDGTSGIDGSDSIIAGDGADTILGSDGNDTIFGGSTSANDTSVDVLRYVDENEGLSVNITGANEGTVAADATTVSLSSLSNQVLNTSTGRVTVGNQTSTDWTDQFSGIEKLELTNQDDIIAIGSTAGLLNTQAGSGQLDGMAGFDVLDYSAFTDTQVVRANLSTSAVAFDIDNSGVVGDDTEGRETTLLATRTATRLNAASTTDADGGDDAIAAGTGSLSTFSSIEGVIGGAASDVLAGDDNANLLVGNDGDDLISGGGGDDTIYGGEGNDFIIPGEGSDLVYGGAGINTIRVSGSDLANDTFVIDPNGVNVFELFDAGGGADNDVNTIDVVGNFDPGAQGIDLVDGGQTTKSIDGDGANNTINLSLAALKNIGTVSGGDGADTISTSPTGKIVNTSYFGGDGTTDTSANDSISLTLTFEQIRDLNASGEYVANLQNYLDSPSGKTFSSETLPFTASQFESGSISVSGPAIMNALQGDPIATTFNTALGVDLVTVASGAELDLSAQATADSTATTSSVPHIVSSLVQANNVKGADQLTATVGTDFTADFGAEHNAVASAVTVDNRSDAVLAAYGLGIDRSSAIVGEAAEVTISAEVLAATTAESKNYVVNASGVVEAAGSRDSSLTAGTSLDLNISAESDQGVVAENVSGLATANLANRVYGIDDANVTDITADFLLAGSALDLSATASGENRVSASSVRKDDLGTLTLSNNGTSTTDLITTSLTGSAFPLINGDLIRFDTSGGGVDAGRDYYVLNVTPVTGEFQIASTPNGDPIEITGAPTTALQAYRPALATADAMALATAVDLNAATGISAGTELAISASADQTVVVGAESVDAQAVAGLNRLGAMDELNTDTVSRITGIGATTSIGGTEVDVAVEGSLDAAATASSVAGRSETELNAAVLGSSNSSMTAGTALDLQTGASLTLSGASSSIDGGSEARVGSGAGAGAGAMDAGTAGIPASSTFAQAQALTGASQVAGTDLSVQALTSVNLDAAASNVGGERELDSATASATGNYLEVYNHRLAQGDVVQVSADGTSGLTTGIDYYVQSLGFGAVNDAADTINWGDRDGDGTVDVVLADGTPIRFGLNTTNSFTDQGNRYGLDMGQQYYVLNGTGTEFQVALTVGGAAIDLSADSVGQFEQLMALDYIQLALTPDLDAASEVLAASTGDVNLSLPSAATAFAGSRDIDLTLSDTTSELTKAMAWGIQGVSGAATVLQAGDAANVRANSQANLSALASNVESDATAATGIENQAMDYMAVTAGTTGVINALANTVGSAVASTVGDSATLDDAVANLNLVSRGIRAGEANDDITIGTDGTINVSAAIAGESLASTVKGDASALADSESTALRFDTSADAAITIGENADLSAFASIGLGNAPLTIEAVAAAEGNALATGASEVTGILGYYDNTSGAFTQINVGTDADIEVAASSNLNLEAFAVDGTATALLESTGSGMNESFTVGVRDLDLTIGGDLNLDASAIGQVSLLAQTVEGNASSYAKTLTDGIMSSGGSVDLSIVSGQHSSIAALAQQADFAKAVSVSGNASSDVSNVALGLSNGFVTAGMGGDLDLSSRSQVMSQAFSIDGNARA